jgi:hypothetical protein
MGEEELCIELPGDPLMLGELLVARKEGVCGRPL